MVVKYELNPDRKLTEAQIEELHEAAKRPICFDEDSPEVTAEMAKKAYRPGRKISHTGEPLTLFLPHETVEAAKAFGDDYISILSRMLDDAVKKRAAM